MKEYTHIFRGAWPWLALLVLPGVCVFVVGELIGLSWPWWIPMILGGYGALIWYGRSRDNAISAYDHIQPSSVKPEDECRAPWTTNHPDA